VELAREILPLVEDHALFAARCFPLRPNF